MRPANTRIAIGAATGAVLALAGCRSPLPSTPAPSTGGAGACGELARVFRDAAEKRDQGVSRESQIRWARASADDPATPDPSGTLRYLLQTIDFVYGRPEVDADGIEAQVLACCLVNDEGRAVLYLPTP